MKRGHQCAEHVLKLVRNYQVLAITAITIFVYHGPWIAISGSSRTFVVLDKVH